MHSMQAEIERLNNALRGFLPANHPAAQPVEPGPSPDDEQPEPFCKKHPNTAFSDTGCLFCGIPPSEPAHWAEMRALCTCPKPGTSSSSIDPLCQIGFPHPWHSLKSGGSL